MSEIGFPGSEPETLAAPLGSPIWSFNLFDVSFDALLTHNDAPHRKTDN